MKNKSFVGLKDEKGAALDVNTTKEMSKCLEDLTSSGNATLNETELKKFKKFCRKSDDYVRYAFMLIMEQLEKKHSEIRLSAFQVAAEIFTRSHAFREILTAHLEHFFTLTTGTETSQPLPPPKPAADKLKECTLRTFQQWHDNYGKSYRKLEFGYNFLKNCKHVDFQNIIARNEAERLRAEREEKRKQKQMADRLTKVTSVIAENKPEIEDCIKEAENCLKLLLPTPENFQLFTPEDAVQSDTPESTSEQSQAKAESSSSITSKPGEIDNTNDKSEGDKIKDVCDLKGVNSKSERDLLLVKSNEEVSHHISKSDSNSSLCCDSDKEETSRCSNGKDDDLSTSPEKEMKDASNSSVRESHTDCEEEAVSEDEDEYNSDELEDDRAHGFGNPGVSINIEIPVENISVKETDDNTDVLQTLKDAAKLINSIFLPRVTKWLEVLGKNGGSQSDIKSIIDLKLNLESVKSKCTELKMVFAGNMGDQDSDDDDFEDVPEKEGYEANVLPSVVRPLMDEGASSSKNIVEKPGLKRNHTFEPSTSNSDLKSSPLKKAKSTASHWSLKDRGKEYPISDPTSLAAALARIKSEETSDESKPSSSTSLPSTTKAESSHPVPFVDYGTELDYWEDLDKIEAPETVQLGSLHGFWGSNEKEIEGTSKQHVQLMLNRTFKFTGQFEPVKWSCRAPLLNGKLCPRMDRVKCPFHGRIIPRDESGNPSVKDEPGTSAPKTTPQADTEEYAELPPWRDPELQREIEQTTGHDLGSARSQQLLDKASNKGKGKGKKKKTGLTDVKAASNTTRSRLAKKVFDKRSLRKICSSLDKADYRRVSDKFGNQFSYNGR